MSKAADIFSEAAEKKGFDAQHRKTLSYNIAQYDKKVKEGKEQNQGVAYLDDGTMIVVEDGRKHMGEHLEVVVTSVLQTVAGKMIFARTKGSHIEGEDFHGGQPSGTLGPGPSGFGGSSSRSRFLLNVEAFHTS